MAAGKPETSQHRRTCPRAITSRLQPPRPYESNREQRTPFPSRGSSCRLLFEVGGSRAKKQSGRSCSPACPPGSRCPSTSLLIITKAVRLRSALGCSSSCRCRAGRGPCRGSCAALPYFTSTAAALLGTFLHRRAPSAPGFGSLSAQTLPCDSEIRDAGRGARRRREIACK